MAWLAIVPAAGSGARLGRDQPKALVPLAGRPLLLYALEMLRAAGIARTVVAGPAASLREIESLLQSGERAVRGGATRAESVRLAFSALAPSPGDVVCIHDAARPFVTPGETADVLRLAERDGAAIAATPIVDTVKRVSAGRIDATLDRTGLWAAATPQAFRADLLDRVVELGREATDEAGICEALGVPVSIAPVSRLGFKITTPEDLDLAEAVLASRGR